MEAEILGRERERGRINNQDIENEKIFLASVKILIVLINRVSGRKDSE